MLKTSLLTLQIHDRSLVRCCWCYRLSLLRMAIETGKVHPTINCDNPDEGLDLDYVREGARDLEVKCALSNSFGFGGHNGTLCIRRYEA